MMIALSTTTPMAMAIPPRLMMLALMPSRCIANRLMSMLLGNDEDRDQRAAAVQQKENAHQRDDDHLLEQRVSERVDGSFDQIGAVVRSLDHHAGRQAVFQVGELGLGVVDDLVSVGAEARNDHAADRFALAVPLADATSFFAGDLQAWPRPTA